MDESIKQPKHINWQINDEFYDIYKEKEEYETVDVWHKRKNHLNNKWIINV